MIHIKKDFVQGLFGLCVGCTLQNSIKGKNTPGQSFVNMPLFVIFSSATSCAQFLFKGKTACLSVGLSPMQQGHVHSQHRCMFSHFNTLTQRIV